MRSERYPTARVMRRKPWAASCRMTTSITGMPPKGTNGLGITSVRGASLTPLPPAKITTRMFLPH